MSAAVMALFAIAGCEKNSEEIEAVDDSMIVLADSQKDNIVVDPSGEILTIRFTAAAQWSVRIPDGSDWLHPTPEAGEEGMVRLKVVADKNETDAARTGVIEICSGSSVKPVTVSQKAFVATFELLDTDVQVSSLGGNIVISVNADVEYKYECEADWIKDASTRAPRVNKHTFIVDPNPLAEERTAMITFCSDMTCKAVTVTQRAAGTSADDWKYDDFRHRSLAMRFTATWCGYCPYMGTAFESAKSQMAGSLELVSLHGEESNYVFSGTSTLVSKYKVTGFPTGVVDGRASIPNYNAPSTTASVAMEVAQETEQTYPTQTGIAVNSSIDGSDLTVDVELYVKEADSYRVTVLLLEDGIVGYQNGGGNSYTHNDVARLALTSMSGESVRISEDYQIWSNSYSAKIKSGWKAENLEILVYVEKPYGDQEKVSSVEGAKYGKYGDTYIDNCRVVKVGTEAPLEFE